MTARRGFVVAVLAAALAGAYVAWDRDEGNARRPYDLALSRACLAQRTSVETIPRGQGGPPFPGLYVRFPKPGPLQEVAVYFAPNEDRAKEAQMPDSERLARRRNVVFDLLVVDERIVPCLRERPVRSN
jgi:hypothetical protein